MKATFLLLFVLVACGSNSGTLSNSGSNGDAGAAGAAGANDGSSGATFQRASVVIGQADFVSNAAPKAVTGAVTGYTPGSAASDGTRLFLPDTYAQRALGFAALPTKNGATADLVLGQTSASKSGAGTSAAAWYQPQTLHTDGTTLAVADSGNHRVLLLPVEAKGGAAASTLVGWQQATTPSSGCSPSLLSSPASAFIFDGKLLVADRGNNRVLIWNKLPTKNGASADLVLGQSSLTSCVSNDSLSNGTTGVRSASTLSGPTDVWTDGTRILVADRDNNRVLIWAKLPKVNGAAADAVLGQGDFTLARDEASASTLYRPSALAVSDSGLFVADAGHNRVLGWNTLPTKNGTAADVVLGQSDFSHAAANDDEQTGKAGTTPTARTLAFPSGVAFAGSALVVSDTLNRRFLVFQQP